MMQAVAEFSRASHASEPPPSPRRRFHLLASHQRACARHRRARPTRSLASFAAKASAARRCRISAASHFGLHSTPYMTSRPTPRFSMPIGLVGFTISLPHIGGALPDRRQPDEASSAHAARCRRRPPAPCCAWAATFSRCARQLSANFG